MTSTRSAAAKKAEKNAWIIGEEGLPLFYGIDLISIGAAQTARSTAQRGGRREWNGCRISYDVIAGSFLDGGRLEFEIFDLKSRNLGWRCFIG
jgi:hypothetical protein